MLLTFSWFRGGLGSWDYDGKAIERTIVEMSSCLGQRRIVIQHHVINQDYIPSVGLEEGSEVGTGVGTVMVNESIRQSVGSFRLGETQLQDIEEAAHSIMRATGWYATHLQLVWRRARKLEWVLGWVLEL